MLQQRALPLRLDVFTMCLIPKPWVYPKKKTTLQYHND